MTEQQNKYKVSVSRRRKRHVFKGLNLEVSGVIHIAKADEAPRGRGKGAGCRGKLLGIHRTSVSKALYELVQKGFLDSKYGQAASRDSNEHQIRDGLKCVSQRSPALSCRTRYTHRFACPKGNRRHDSLGGQTEVVTAVGRVDLLTTKELIEVKSIERWKEALEQILAYSSFFPTYSKRIHLFGKPDFTKLALAQSDCSEFDVTVTFEVVQGDDK